MGIHEPAGTKSGNCEIDTCSTGAVSGFADHARMVSALFENRGFEVVSGCCMAGGFSSDDVGPPGAFEEEI